MAKLLLLKLTMSLGSVKMFHGGAEVLPPVEALTETNLLTVTMLNGTG